MAKCRTNIAPRKYMSVKYALCGFILLTLLVTTHAGKYDVDDLKRGFLGNRLWRMLLWSSSVKPQMEEVPHLSSQKFYHLYGKRAKTETRPPEGAIISEPMEPETMASSRARQEEKLRSKLAALRRALRDTVIPD